MARAPSARQQAIAALVKKELEIRATQDITKNEQIAFVELKRAANSFLAAIKSSIAITQHQDLMKSMQAVKELQDVVYGSMRSSSTITKNILAEQHKFEMTLNKFFTGVYGFGFSPFSATPYVK